MSSYDKRGDEIEADLRTNTALPGEEAGAVLSKLVSGLFDNREAALTAMAAVLTTDGNEMLAGDFKEKWHLAIDRWIDPFSRILDGVQNPSSIMTVWREGTVLVENRFFQGLAAINLGEARDAMAQIEMNLEKLSKDLQLKWDTMSEESKRLEAAEAEAARKMTEIVQDSMRGATEAWARYGEALQRFLAPFQKLPDIVNDTIVALAKEAGFPDLLAEAIPKVSLAGKDYFALGKELGIPAKDLAAANPGLLRDPGMAVSETIQKLIGPEFEALVTAINGLYKYVLPIAAGAYGEQIVNYRRLMPNEGAILVSFGQTRRDVDEYLKSNGLDKARSLFERTMADLERWAEGGGTDGQRADAAAFEREVGEAFKRRFERMANAFGMFVQANQGRFIGTPAKYVEENLIFTDVWADREQRLMDIGLDERIKEWRGGTMTVDDQLASASSQLFAGLRYLPSDLNDQISSKLNAYLDGLRSRLKREADAANDALAKAAVAVSDSQIKTDLDRRALKSQLAA